MIVPKAATTIALVFASFLPQKDQFKPAHLSSSEKRSMLEAVNRLRAKGCHCGRKYMPPVGPVRWNANLEKAALVHASDMTRNNFFAHKGSNGSSIGDRATKAGYHWMAVGENIAEGYGSFEATLLAWKDSPGHCRNLMNGGYDEMGIAEINDLWVQDFGASIEKYE
ncbi:MAG: CAP domain-containing protein [Saprospiraceae bacterium]|nr:CAP domain-containing protein [Saprospiraceae bacterium]